jgi:hypothetical protein
MAVLVRLVPAQTFSEFLRVAVARAPSALLLVPEVILSAQMAARVVAGLMPAALLRLGQLLEQP